MSNTWTTNVDGSLRKPTPHILTVVGILRRLYVERTHIHEHTGRRIE